MKGSPVRAELCAELRVRQPERYIVCGVCEQVVTAGRSVSDLNVGGARLRGGVSKPRAWM